MKRMLSLLLAAAVLLGLLSACREPAPSASSAPVKDWTASELAELAFEHSGREGQDGLEGVNAEIDQEWMTAYLENAYGLEEPWEDAAVVRATGASAFEIAVLRMEDESAAVQAATVLMSYIYSRQGDFAGYAPAEADMVANGSIMQDGPFAALFICPDPEGAYQIVKAALSGKYDPDQPEPSSEIIDDVKGLRDFLVSDQGMEDAELEKLDGGDPDALSAYLEEAYGLSRDQWEECAIARDLGGSAFEVAVFRFPGVSNEGIADVELEPGEDGLIEVPVGGGFDGNWERASNLESCLNNYLDAKEAQFDSGTEQAKLLHQSLTITAGEYVVMLACLDAEGAAGRFAKASGSMGHGWINRYRYLDTDPDYSDRCLFTQPNKDDMSIYDTSAILAAWEKGDPAGLSKYDRDIYAQAEKVLGQVLENGMSDYEKELAVYNWAVNNVDYDWTHQDRMEETPRESFTPYGGLVNHTAVCLGYATTFQLLMDMAGVECITVAGAAFSSQEDHGWNMVRLNGEWYCVDVTWDANTREQGGRGRQEDWSFFNVTSDYMADFDHQWDYANTPEATAQDGGRADG